MGKIWLSMLWCDMRGRPDQRIREERIREWTPVGSRAEWQHKAGPVFFLTVLLLGVVVVADEIRCLVDAFRLVVTVCGERFQNTSTGPNLS